MTAELSMENYTSQNPDLFPFSPLVTQRRVSILFCALLPAEVGILCALSYVKCARYFKIALSVYAAEISTRPINYLNQNVC